MLKESGQIAAALEAHRRAIALNPALPAVHSNMLYTLNYDERVSPQALFAVHQAWGRIPGVDVATGAARFTNSPDITRGGCIVQTRFGIIDARRETKFEQLHKTLSP